MMGHSGLTLETAVEEDLTVFCTRCGHPNRDDARFCAGVGVRCRVTPRCR